MNMIEKAAQRVMRDRMVARSANYKLRRYIKDLKDPSQLTNDQVYHALQAEVQLAEANLKSANISLASVKAFPPDSH